MAKSHFDQHSHVVIAVERGSERVEWAHRVRNPKIHVVIIKTRFQLFLLTTKKNGRINGKQIRLEMTSGRARAYTQIDDNIIQQMMIDLSPLHPIQQIALALVLRPYGNNDACCDICLNVTIKPNDIGQLRLGQAIPECGQFYTSKTDRVQATEQGHLCLSCVYYYYNINK